MAHQIGFIGLGNMGKNMVLLLREQGVDVVSYNRTPTPEATVSTIDELVEKLEKPRVIFLMVAAVAVDEVIGQLTLAPGDTIIDGGNTLYKDTVRRSGELSAKGIHFIDCGTSGGLEGARTGACLMLGGDESAVNQLAWLWDGLASKGEALRSWNYFGPSGAGHFVKMVHNGIEYGMDQAIGEGMEVLAGGPYQLDLAKVAATWQHGSIIRSYLIELLAKVLEKDPKLAGFTGKVGGGETGKWMLEVALEARKKSQTNPTFATKVVSALRNAYGGHKEVP